ncbi:MAG: hypothetical protein VX012_10400, partial [Planctomycetota bacterium]|nr:hypothetical protein [Planctomycetota bacterium]
MAVRSFDESTAWVLNHLGDSVTVVDLDNERVLATLNTGAEPADVVFSGTPVRAFVSISQENRVMVFDPAGADSTPVNANCGPDLNR